MDRSGNHHRTGPKISSRQIDMCGITSVKMVGNT
jgi:hypothetical protein